MNHLSFFIFLEIIIMFYFLFINFPKSRVWKYLLTYFSQSLLKSNLDCWKFTVCLICFRKTFFDILDKWPSYGGLYLGKRDPMLLGTLTLLTNGWHTLPCGRKSWYFHIALLDIETFTFARMNKSWHFARYLFDNLFEGHSQLH